MSRLLTPEQRMILDGVHRFVRRDIWLWEKRMDPNATALPPEVAADLAPRVDEMGLRHLGVPERLGIEGAGGPPLDQTTTLLVAMETAQHRAGLFHPCYGLFGDTEIVRLFAATPDQQTRYLLPLLRGEKRAFVALADPSLPGEPTDAVRARARWYGQEWRLAGTKIFARGVAEADFGLLLARTNRADGTEGVTLFIVETASDGFQDWRPYPTIAAAETTSEINLSAVRVPPENVLGEPHAGLAVGVEPVLRHRQTIAARCVGVATQAQTIATAQAWARQEHGAPVATRDTVRWAIAENEIAIAAARGLVLDAGAAADTGTDDAGAAAAGAAGVGARDDEAPIAVATAIARTAIAKTAAVDAAQQVVARAIAICGTHGLSTDLALERWARELQLRALTDGPASIQRAHIAEERLRTFRT